MVEIEEFAVYPQYAVRKGDSLRITEVSGVAELDRFQRLLESLLAQIVRASRLEGRNRRLEKYFRPGFLIHCGLIRLRQAGPVNVKGGLLGLSESHYLIVSAGHLSDAFLAKK